MTASARKTAWRGRIRSYHDFATHTHWTVLAASDLMTVEVWTAKGLVTHYLPFVISIADRVVDIAGITTRPDEQQTSGFADVNA